jgi:hypothetical protein
VDEVIDEAHLNVKWLREGIARFAAARDERLARLRVEVPAER